jgi:hypothetical protein
MHAVMALGFFERDSRKRFLQYINDYRGDNKGCWKTKSVLEFERLPGHKMLFTIIEGTYTALGNGESNIYDMIDKRLLQGHTYRVKQYFVEVSDSLPKGRFNVDNRRPRPRWKDYTLQEAPRVSQ